MPTSGSSFYNTSGVRIDPGNDGIAVTLHLLLVLVALFNLVILTDLVLLPTGLVKGEHTDVLLLNNHVASLA